MDKSNFEIALGAKVMIIRSGEKGIVTSRADYFDNYPPNYQVEFTSADGRAIKDWFILRELEVL